MVTDKAALALELNEKVQQLGCSVSVVMYLIPGS